MQGTIDKLYAYFLQYGLNILAAIIIFILGRMVATFVSNIVEAALVRARINVTLASFAKYLGFYGIMTFVVIASLNKLGVETSSFIAVVGAASLAVGLALQGSLSNFASGVMLILFHPFKVGDVIDAGGAQGRVQEIQIFNTIIISIDNNKKIIVPNSKITGDRIIADMSAKD